MKKTNWKARLFPNTRISARPSVMSGTHVLGATAVDPGSRARPPADTKLGDIPVFDRRRQRVGFIPALEMMGDSDEQSSQALLSHGMNSSISWLAGDSQRVNTEQLRHATFLRRVPLMDDKSQLCGIVVFEVDERFARSRQNAADVASTAPVQVRR